MPHHGPLLSGNNLEAGVQVGDFRIEERLGAGGMGIVYRARQVSLNRPVALKVLGQALTRDSDVARFQREAQAAARLRHPGIAQVHYIGQDRHLCFLAMELIEGISLRQALDRLGTATAPGIGLDTAVRDELGELPPAKAVRFDVPTNDPSAAPACEETLLPGRLPPGEDANPYQSPLSIQARELRTTKAHVRRCCELVRDAAHALAHAHEQGVVHRDIKPDNLLLDAQGNVHLIDFGVARFFDDHTLTATGQLVGTPLYMSPEQVTGRGVVDARTDIYSLGLVLYELLTLVTAVQATNREHLLRTIVTKPLPPVSWRNKAVPAGVEHVVHKATQKDPDERYANAEEFAADLDRFLAGQPVKAPPYRFRLDEREIMAARPESVVFSAVIFYVLGLLICTITASIAGAGMNSRDPAIPVLMLLGAIVILALGIGVGRGLLVGQESARTIAITLGGLLICLAMVLFGLLAMQFSNSEKADLPFDDRFWFRYLYLSLVLPGLLGLTLGSVVCWSLLKRNTIAWFCFARQIRLEHSQMQRELG